MRTKFLSLILFLFALIFVFSGCDQGSEGHVHGFSSQWSADNTYHWHQCVSCSETEGKEEHSWDSGVTIKEATEDENGTILYTCLICKYTKTEAVNKKDHEHSFVVTNTDDKYLKTPANCLNKAVYYYSCSCGEHGEETFEFGEALGHNFENYISDNNATCGADGTKTAKCSRCDETDTVTDVGSKLPHTYSEQWDKDENYHWHNATCGHVEAIANYSEHEYENGICVICKAIEQVEVIFLDVDGTILSAQIIDYGTSAIEPDCPIKEDYYFDCWIGSYTNVIENTIITASYKKYLKVTFYNYDLSIIEEQKVKTGDSAIRPKEDPKREGYVFIGWDILLDNITKDTDVIAQYEIEFFDVVFKSPNDEDIDIQSVAYGLCAIEPLNYSKYYCERDGVKAKAFSGWYCDGVMVDLSKLEIKENKTIYAKYESCINNPVIILKKTIEGEIGNQKTVVNIYISMPQDQLLFAIDMRINWDNALIDEFSEIAGYLADQSIYESNYSQKNHYFTLSLANASGINDINEKSTYHPVISITFKEGSPTFSLANDSSFMMGTSIDNLTSVCPEILVVQ